MTEANMVTGSQMSDGRIIDFAAAFSNDILHLIILPTEQCNFRCTYCYEDFSIGTMKRPVVNGVKSLLAKRIPSLRQLHIAWFGGEPLLALPIVEEISSFAQTRMQDVADIAYTAEMTTNAFRLDSPTAERLHGLGIRHYQITLDGPEEFHDKARVRRNGKGSFNQIWGNLLSVRSSSLPISVCLRVHVTHTIWPPCQVSWIDSAKSFLSIPGLPSF